MALRFRCAECGGMSGFGKPAGERDDLLRLRADPTETHEVTFFCDSRGAANAVSITPEMLPTILSRFFFPLVLWFSAIVATVLGIYPRRYAATTDLQKEAAIRKLRNTKRRWLSAALLPFLAGFGLFLYVIGAQIWRSYPFG